MKYVNPPAFLVILFALLLTSCDSASTKFEPEANQFTWEGTTIPLAKFEWTSESTTTGGSYKFDFVLNDQAENHELYFEDLLSPNADYEGEYTYVDNSSSADGTFDWFGLEVNVNGNTTDNPFDSSDFVSGSVSISYPDGYLLVEFRMTHSSGKVVSGYYAEEV